MAHRISPSPANDVPWLRGQVAEMERELITRRVGRARRHRPRVRKVLTCSGCESVDVVTYLDETTDRIVHQCNNCGYEE